MGLLFDRQYRFKFGGHEVGGSAPGQPTALRIHFTVEKCDTETPNTALVSVWNLNPGQIAALNEKDCHAELMAGYGNNMPLIFEGYVTYVKTLMDGADRETSIEICDGRVPLRDTYCSLSYAGVVNARTVIDDIAGDMELAVTYSHNADFADFPRGFSFIGPARVGLDKACATSGLQWKIYDGVLYVKMERDTMDRDVYLLSPDSGLIGVPKKILIASEGYGLDEQAGVEVRYLMNGAIAVSDYVRVESRDIQGFYVVKWLELSGDNIRGDWICTAKLIEA